MLGDKKSRFARDVHLDTDKGRFPMQQHVRRNKVFLFERFCIQGNEIKAEHRLKDVDQCAFQMLSGRESVSVRILHRLSKAVEELWLRSLA